MLKPFAQDQKGSGPAKTSLWLYLFLSLLAFSPCLFLGQAYFDNDLLAQFGPWRAFLKGQLAQGHFPLWNPYSLGGQPFFADLQNMMLYPFNYLTLPFPVPMGLSVFFFIHLFWAAFGMHLWLKSFGLSENSCRVGALLFAFSGFFWLELIHPPVLAAFAWLPWLFARLERLAQNPKPWNAFTTGFCFAMLFLCGSFQVTVGAFYGGLIYFLFRFLFEKNENQKFSPKTIVPLCLFLVWGALPLLGQLIPTMEFSSLSTRNSPDVQSEKLNTQLSLNPLTLGQFFFPRILLEPGQDMAESLQSRQGDPEFRFAANWGYLGIWFPFLAWGAWWKKEKALSLFLSAFAVLDLVFCFGRFTPVYSLVSSLLPGFSMIRVPYRFLYLYVLAASALAALGWNHWFKPEPGGGPKIQSLKYLRLFVFGLFLAALVKWRQTWVEFLCLSIGFEGLYFYFGLHLRRSGKIMFFISLLLPLLLNGWGDFVPGPASNFDFVKKSQAIIAAADSVKPNRVLLFNQEMYFPIQVGGQKYLLNYPQNAACALRIKNFGGYNPLMLQTKAEIGTLPLKPLVQLGAIKGLLTQKDLKPIPDFKAESFPPYWLYEYQKPLPYAYAPQNLLVEPDSARRLTLLQNPGFDTAQTAILSSSFPVEWNQGLPANLECRLEKEETDQQTFSIHLDQAHLVVFCEVMFPGWKAFIDGQPAPLYTADHFLRAVYVPAGPHQVEFRFNPAWWLPIQVGLGIWLLVTFTGLLFTWRPGKGTSRA